MELDENLKKRIISAAILAPIALVMVWMGGVLFYTLMLIAAVIMAFEWCSITGIATQQESVSRTSKIWMVVGIAYIVISVGSMMYIRSLVRGELAVLFLLLTVWVVDIAAYFSGKMIGGPKILPSISPKKTWAGLVGGMVAAGCVNVIIGLFFGSPVLGMFLFGAALAVIAQLGDFFESWVKRTFGVKDSGMLIPGHGGLLDRIDGFTTTAPVIALMAMLSGGTISIW